MPADDAPRQALPTDALFAEAAFAVEAASSPRPGAS